MKVAVDTSVLLDVLGADPEFGSRSRDALKKAWTSGSVIVCDVVLAEVSAFFPPGEDPAAVLAEMGIAFEPLSAEAAVEAGRRWKAFRAQGGKRRDRVIADFLVGAHALLAADVLLTRDRGFYRSAFSGLRILEP